jgi:23S rRNA (cytosine1962-C5)-methyltransferase
MRAADKWSDYEVLDAGAGEKLERWGRYRLIRPDPQVIWSGRAAPGEWSRADGHYIRSSEGGGHWENLKVPESWSISYGGLKFALKPMGFKHTGLFPEQAVNWDWLGEKISSAGRPVKVLNLFAYTGGATLACAAAGAQVVHVDAAKGMVAWAKENAAASGLGGRPVRYIVDDCLKFAAREGRRGNLYDGIIMDPPSYGRGPGGEIWKLEEKLGELLELCSGLLSPEPLFFMINSYTTGLSASVMAYMLGITAAKGRKGRVSADEIGLRVRSTGLVLPCGSTAVWESLR